jgi:hypothetical protein
MPPDPLLDSAAVRDAEFDAEVVAEEDGGPAVEAAPLPEPYAQRNGLPALRGDVRTAAIAAAGGAIAGVATVAAVRAVSGAPRKGSGRRLARRSERPRKVVASRSFLVDVHLLGS